jgi:U3 small nucleolar ribonucleoprotein protein IMP4
VSNVLKHLFPVPKDDSKRVVTFANQSDFISFRHHTYDMPRGAKSVALKEVGPRFEMRLYRIKLGTMEQQEAEVEWALRPYMCVWISRHACACADPRAFHSARRSGKKQKL